MIINTSGNIGIGTKLVTNTNRLEIFDLVGTNKILQLTNTGILSVSNDIIGFDNLSDKRLKTNIMPLYKNTIDIINKITPIQFTWKDINFINENRRNTPDCGFIAQEIEELFPHLIIKIPSTIYKGLRYEKFAPYLVKGIQELYILIQEQKNEINDLRIYIKKYIMKHKQFYKNKFTIKKRYMI
jgi:hypothetical protein